MAVDEQEASVGCEIVLPLTVMTYASCVRRVERALGKLEGAVPSTTRPRRYTIWSPPHLMLIAGMALAPRSLALASAAEARAGATKARLTALGLFTAASLCGDRRDGRAGLARLGARPSALPWAGGPAPRPGSDGSRARRRPALCCDGGRHPLYDHLQGAGR